MMYLRKARSRRIILLPILVQLILLVCFSGKLVSARPQDDQLSISTANTLTDHIESQAVPVNTSASNRYNSAILRSETRYNSSDMLIIVDRILRSFMNSNEVQLCDNNCVDEKLLKRLRNSELVNAIILRRNSKDHILLNYISNLDTYKSNQRYKSGIRKTNTISAKPLISLINLVSSNHLKFFIFLLFIRLLTLYKNMKQRIINRRMINILKQNISYDTYSKFNDTNLIHNLEVSPFRKKRDVSHSSSKYFQKINKPQKSEFHLGKVIMQKFHNFVNVLRKVKSKLYNYANNIRRTSQKLNITRINKYFNTSKNKNNKKNYIKKYNKININNNIYNNNFDTLVNKSTSSSDIIEITTKERNRRKRELSWNMFNQLYPIYKKNLDISHNISTSDNNNYKYINNNNYNKRANDTYNNNNYNNIENITLNHNYNPNSVTNQIQNNKFNNSIDEVNEITHSRGEDYLKRYYTNDNKMYKIDNEHSNLIRHSSSKLNIVTEPSPLRTTSLVKSESVKRYDKHIFKDGIVDNFIENTLPHLQLIGKVNYHYYPNISLPTPQTKSTDEPDSSLYDMPFIIVEDVDSSLLPKPTVDYSENQPESSSLCEGDYGSVSENCWNRPTSNLDYYQVPLYTKPKPHIKPVSYFQNLYSQNSIQQPTSSYSPDYSQNAGNSYISLQTHQTSASNIHNIYDYPSQNYWNIPEFTTTNIGNYLNQGTSTSTSPPYSSDIILEFPYPTASSVNVTILNDPLPNYSPSPSESPMFIEPIGVSNFEELPASNLPQSENVSLGHNPLTVLVGSSAPEIVLLDDINNTYVQDRPSSAQDPPTGSGSSSAAAGGSGGGGAAISPSLLLATGAGGGAGLGAAALGGTALGVGIGLGTGLGVGLGVGLGTGLGGQLNQQQRPDNFRPQRPTFRPTFRPSTFRPTFRPQEQNENEEEEEDEEEHEEEHEHEEQEEHEYPIVNIMMSIMSFQLLKRTMQFIWTMLTPHIQLLLSTGLTIISFIFPWLFPYIIDPALETMASMSASRESRSKNKDHSNQIIDYKENEEQIGKLVYNKDRSSQIYGEFNIHSGLDFGRSGAPIQSTTKSTSDGEVVRTVTNQLLPQPEAVDMVATDIRTPPKIKSQITHAHGQNANSPGKGEAIPVILDENDEAALEKLSSENFKYTHSDLTSPGGISTWILLNSDSSSTPYSHHKKVQKPMTFESSNKTAIIENVTDQKRTKPVKYENSTSISSEKPLTVRNENSTRKPDRKPIAFIQKLNQTTVKKTPVTTARAVTEDPIISTTVSLQDSKFKNKTPIIMGKVPLKDKQDIVNATVTTPPLLETMNDKIIRLGTPVITYPHVPPRHRPSVAASPNRKLQNQTHTTSFNSTTINYNNTNLSDTSQLQEVPITTVIPLSSVGTVVTTTATNDVSTINTSIGNVTKKSTGSKKKKKNKNKKRKRPSKNNATKIQSKISDDDNGTSKLPTSISTQNRPLSTRIYNYLAREVMPNVGVGLVGLVLTAGLAGLLLYPFGAPIPVRRNYEKPASSNGMYNLNDYPSVGEVDNGQPEESVFGQVLAGMNHGISQFSREQPDTRYNAPPRYKPIKHDNHNNYNRKETPYPTEKIPEETIKYSELGDVVSGPHESVKFTSFDNSDGTKYTERTKYTTIDKSHPVDTFVDLTSDNKQIDLTNSYTLSKVDTNSYANNDLKNSYMTSNLRDDANNPYDASKPDLVNSYSESKSDVIGDITYGSSKADTSLIYSNNKAADISSSYGNKGSTNTHSNNMGDVHNSYGNNKDDTDALSMPYNSNTGDITLYNSIKADLSNVDETGNSYNKFSPIKEISSPKIQHAPSVYSTLGSYASYNNPNEPIQHPVYNGEAYNDYKNHKGESESADSSKEASDKPQDIEKPSTQTEKSSKLEQPMFEALEGIPKNYRTVDTSITIEDVALPMNEDDFVPITGMYKQGEHGPRTMKLTRRKKRNTWSENEVDSDLQEPNIIQQDPNKNVQSIPSSETKTFSPNINNNGASNDAKTNVTTDKLDNNEMENELKQITGDNNTTASSLIQITTSMIENSSVEASNIQNSNSTVGNNLQLGTDNNIDSVLSTENGTKNLNVGSEMYISTLPPPDQLQEGGVKNSTTDNENEVISPIEDCGDNCVNIDNLPSATEEPPKPATPGFSLTNFIQKILHFKIRIGLELIRSTTEAISRYVTTVQKRMTEAVREMQRMNSKSDHTQRIQKRDRFFFPFG